MFCQKCGHQLPDGSSFCNNCGAPQPVSGSQQHQPQQQPYYQNAPQQHSQYTPYPPGQPPVTPKKPKKKSTTPIWLSLIIIIAAYALGRYLIAPAIFDNDSKNDNNSSIPTDASVVIDDSGDSSVLIDDESEEESAVPVVPEDNSSSEWVNSEYTAIFSNAGLFDAMIPSSEISGYSYAAYVGVDADGNIDKMEFGYDGDIVYTMVETIYFPITGVDPSYYSSLDAEMREGYAFMEEYDFCELSFALPDGSTSTPYYTVTLIFRNLDNPSNVQALAEIGILDTANATYVSLAASDSGLTQNGYVKR